MSELSESRYYPADFGDIDKESSQSMRMTRIGFEIIDVCQVYDYIAEAVPVEDELGLRIETVIGGLAPTEADSKDYAHVTLVRSANFHRKITTLVVEDEEYDISADGVSQTSVPHHILDAEGLDKISYWLKETFWSRDDTVRLTDKRRKQQREKQIERLDFSD